MSNEIQAASMPSYLSGYAKQGIGMPKIDMKELRIPLLKTIQLQGEAYDAEKNNFGNIYDHISLQDFGNSIDVVVLDFKTTWQKWGSDRKLLGSSPDGIRWATGNEEYIGKTIEETEGTAAYKCKHYEFYVLLLNANKQPSLLPYKLSFSGMSAAAGNKIYQILAQKAITEGAPMFSFIFNIRTTKEKGERGQYAMFHAELRPGVVSENVAKVAVEAIKTINSTDVKIIEEQVAPVQEEKPIQEPEVDQEKVKHNSIW